MYCTPAGRTEKDCPEFTTAKMAAQPNPVEEEGEKEVAIILIGKTGAGKSTLLNNLLGRNQPTSLSPQSQQTTNVSQTVSRNDITFRILDMTGLKGSEEDIGKKLRQLSGSKVHFFLYCLPVGPGSKFEDTNPVIMKCMQVAFGKQVWEHCIVVLTQSNLAMGHITAAQQSTDYSQYIGEYTQCFQQELQTLSKLIDMTTFNIFLPTPSPPPIVPAGLKVTDGMTLDSKNWKEVLFEEMSKGHGHVPMTLNYRHEYEYWRRVYNVRWGIIAGVGAGLGANCGFTFSFRKLKYSKLATTLNNFRLLHLRWTVSRSAKMPTNSRNLLV